MAKKKEVECKTIDRQTGHNSSKIKRKAKRKEALTDEQLLELYEELYDEMYRGRGYYGM